MKVSDYIFEFLSERGVDTVFYLPGGGCMHCVDSLGANKKIKAIQLLHEQAVAVACEAYASTRNAVGAALVTTGPGATNTITGMLAAYLDSVPCVFISGQVKTADLKSRYGVRSLGSQEADIVSIVSSITKYAVMVTEKDTIRYHLERAWHEATSGRRGPVLLDIPLDVQGAQVDEKSLAGYDGQEHSDTGSACNDGIDKIIEGLNNSKRPLLIVGNGIAKCRALFTQLKDKLGIPVIPSWKAMDVIANDDPLYAGRAGGMGDRHGNFTMQSADFILSLGCRLDFSITGYDRGKWAPGAQKIVIDIDPTEIAKLEQADNIFGFTADVSCVIKELLQRENELSKPDISSWKEKINGWKENYPLMTSEKYRSSGGALTTYALVDVLSKNLSDNACISPCSSGTTAEIFFQAFTVKSGQKIRSNHGLGSMGFEIPNAIGMCVAAGKKDVICIAGDGGMQLNIQELATIRGCGLPIKIFVVNNNGYASIRNMQNNHFNGRHVGCDGKSGLFLPDLGKLSLAYDIPYYKVNGDSATEHLEAVVKQALAEKGPAICEVEVDGECYVTPRSATMIMEDGSMQSSPLENQYPFLSEGELKKNMV